MRLVKIQFSPWDKVYYFSPAGLELVVGEKVAVKTELGIELGDVVGFVDSEDKEIIEKDRFQELDENGNAVLEKIENVEKKAPEIKPILRKATASDLEKMPKLSEKKKALEHAKKAKEKYDLPMKFIDVNFSFDGSRITFAFIADGRVDFRELVKELTRHFGRTIRLQQIGIRDEAKISGDFGHCGKPLCCKRFLNDFTSITSEMAELQQCSHRGSERISGICGRLMCCLAYEEGGYEKLFATLPAIGTKVNVDGKRGVVVGHHILKQSVDVRFKDKDDDIGTVIEIDLNRHKKKLNK